ncbi:MAG: tetratricopeptide repeat protein [Bacteroidia bacterium]
MSKKKNKHNKPVIASAAKQSPGSVGLPRPAKSGTRNDASLRWAYIFLFIFAVVLYANTLNHSFAFDDSVVISGNKYTKEGLHGIKTLATKDLFYGIYGNSLDLEGGRWRPLTLVMFAVEYQFFGDNASPYHFINVLLYGITAMVLFMTLMQVLTPLSRGRGAGGEVLAFITTLLFIAHPIHTEVVANIKSRDEIMSFMFLCLMLFNLFRFVKTENKKFIFYGVLCYFTALLSKENGITFVAIIPLALFCFAKKNIKESLMLTIPFLVTAGIYLAIRTSLVGMIGDRQSNDITDNPFLALHFPALPTPIPFMEKFATVCWILLKYLLLLIFPHPLTSDYGFNQIPVIGFSDPKAIASVLIYGGLLFYAIKNLLQEIKRRSLPETSRQPQEPIILSFCILFFVITIIIVSNLFFLIGTTMGERFAYISSLGFCLALASIILKITKTENLELRKDIFKNPKLAFPLLLLLIPYSYKTITRNPAWKDNKTLFTTDVKTSTGSANAHYYYANTMFTDHLNDDPSPKRDSLFVEAKVEFRKAMAINPYFHYCYYNIGLIWEKLGNPDSAIFYQQKTLNLKPDNTMAQYMAKGALGLVYGKLKGDFEHAIPLLKEALLNKPDDEGYHENLGICYAMKGDFDGSIKEFETAIKLKPTFKKEDARIFMNLALSWQNKGNKQKADENFQRAFELDPSLKK